MAATGIVIVFSILASMGLGGWAGLPFSPPISPAPTIVLMIVVANCVHLLVALQQRLRAGDSKHDAIVESLRLNLHPVFLASLTTALGFLSMNFSEVPPYRHLGIFVAFGIASSFFLSVTFLPALLSLLGVRATKERRLRGPGMGSLADYTLRHRKWLLWGWVVVVPAMILAIPRNELNDVLVHFFDESVEFRQDTDFMDEHLSGNTLLEYSLHASAEGGATDPRLPRRGFEIRRVVPRAAPGTPRGGHHRHLPATQQEHARRRPRRVPHSRKARSSRPSTCCSTSCRFPRDST